MIDLLGERYNNDPYFNKLVDVFLNQMEKQETTAREIRDAAMYAQYIFELHHPSPFIVYQESGQKIIRNGVTSDNNPDGSN